MPNTTGGFEPVYGLVDILWDGVPIPIEPKQRKILHVLITKGEIYRDQISGNPSCAAVHMSRIREVLSDMGIPYTVVCPQGRRYNGEKTVYRLVKLEEK